MISQPCPTAGLTGDDYFWLKLKVEGRPVFALSHRLVSSGEHLFIYAVNAWIAHWKGIEALDKAIGKKYLGSHMKSLLTDHGICE